MCVCASVQACVCALPSPIVCLCMRDCMLMHVCTSVCMCVQLDALNYEQEGLLQRIRTEREYVNKDEITVSPDHLPNYEEKVCVLCTVQGHMTRSGELATIRICRTLMLQSLLCCGGSMSEFAVF